MRKYFIFLGWVILMAGCMPFNKTGTTLSDVKVVGQQAPQGLLFALPMTTLDVRVEATCIDYKKGPYSEFTRKMLELDDYVDKDREEWILNSVDIQGSVAPDPGQYYQIITDENLQTSAFRLTRQGLLLIPDVADANQQAHAAPAQLMPYDALLFPMRNPNGPTREYRDTAYRTVARDTSFIQMPVLVTRDHTLTFEEKAAETAQLLERIRKRRFRLVSRNNEDISLPDGPGLETAVKELDKLEEEYLALFTGKKVYRKVTYHFLVTPSDTAQNPQVVFRFLSALGVLPPDDLRGDAVTLTWKPRSTVPPKILYSEPTTEPATPVIHYRIPEVSTISVAFGDKMLFSKNLLLYQLGEMTQLPANIFFQPVEENRRK